MISCCTEGITFAEQCRQYGNAFPNSTPLPLDQHAGETWMNWQVIHPSAKGGQSPLIQRLQSFKQLQGVLQRAGLGLFEPGKMLNIAFPPAVKLQNGRGQVNPLNLRFLLVRSIPMTRLIPKTDTDSRLHPTRASCTLI